MWETTGVEGAGEIGKKRESVKDVDERVKEKGEKQKRRRRKKVKLGQTM